MPRNTSEDVLDSNDSKILRKHDLKRAVMLGATYNQECNIEYIDNTGRSQMMIARVIGMSDENAFLHNERIIPIKRISRVIV